MLANGRLTERSKIAKIAVFRCSLIEISFGPTDALSIFTTPDAHYHIFTEEVKNKHEFLNN
jgi:hypothetical protein